MDETQRKLLVLSLSKDESAILSLLRLPPVASPPA
jgi:hypothetical protein